jgi:hypothetical protein
LARYQVAWHALIASLRHDPTSIDPTCLPATTPDRDTNPAELEARVRHIVESDGGTKALSCQTRETIVRLVLPKLVSGDAGRPDQRGTSDDSYERLVKRLARNVAMELFQQDPQLLRALIDQQREKPLMFPTTESELPLDEKRLGRFKRRFKRLSYRDRFLLRLVVIDEQTIAHIADQTKVSFADATTRLFKLFARLGP